MADTINYGKVKGETGSGATPVGTILPWSQATAPSGFLKCDGSAISRATYSDLFDVIGTSYGVGDGSTTFNLPDLTSRSIVGANTTTNVGQTSGAHDTAGAGFAVQNNLQAQNSQNLAALSASNVAVSPDQNLAVSQTQNLAVQNTQNLALDIQQNLAVGITQNLAVSKSGSVTNHTLSLAQLPAHAHPGQSLNPAGGPGPFRATTTTAFGNAGSNQAHTHSDDFVFGVQGTASGGVQGSVTGAVQGTATNALSGVATATFDGTVTPQVQGNVTTNLQGNVSTAVAGDVTAASVSIFEPHVVVIYIIKV